VLSVEPPLKVGERREGAGEDRLDEVVDLGVGAEQAVEVAAHLGLVAVVELAQRPAIARTRLRQHDLLGRR
jgi:hypothetical protein